MFRLVIFLILLFAAAISFAWLADRPGSVTVNWPWLGMIVEVTLLRAMIGLAVIIAVIMMVWWLLSSILRSPETYGRWNAGRRRDKGYAALSRGLVAAGAGNAPLARQLTKESGRYLDNEPMVKMLDAQTALLEGKRDVARQKYETMLEDDTTKLLGLRGLHEEAEREGNGEAAGHFAREAYAISPETPWAAVGLLKIQGNVGDWTDALNTLDANRAAGMYERDEYSRKRAVILTALANQVEDEDPDKARTHALAAHRLAPDLQPAAVTAARICKRLDDNRKARKVLEASWKKAPHPDIADAYLDLASGEGAADRLKQAEKLARKQDGHTQSRLMIAGAAIDAVEFDTARSELTKVLAEDPCERACLMMADLDEAEHGDRGRVREWLARAVSAPRDPVWTADGIVSEKWAPVSPASGRLDAFEWKVPVEEVGGGNRALDYSNIPAHEPAVEVPEAQEISEKPEQEDDEPTTIQMAQAAVATSGLTGAVLKTGSVIVEDDEAKSADIEDAEVIDVETPVIVKPEPVEEIIDREIAMDDARVQAQPATEAKSPFNTADHDQDADGQIDHRPDDPGPRVPKKKRKNFFF